DLAFNSQIANGTSQLGIFLASGGQLIKVAADKDQAPGGGTLSLEESFPTVNNNRDVLFSASTNESSSTNDSPKVSNIYLFTSGVLKRVVGAGDPTPDGSKFDSVQAKGRFLNDERQIAFLATVDSKLVIYIISVDDGKLTRIVGTGDSSPDGGTFTSLNFSL